MKITPAEEQTGPLWENLNKVVDPELGIGIVDMGLVYRVVQDEEKVLVDLTMTTPACPSQPEIIKDVEEKLTALDTVSKVKVNVVWEPAWNPDMMDQETRYMFLGV